MVLKSSEIQGGGQKNGCDGSLMAKILIMTIQVNICISLCLSTKLTSIVNFSLTYHHSYFLAAIFAFTTFYKRPQLLCCLTALV